MSAKPRPVICCTNPVPPITVDEATHASLVGVFKALSDPTRLDIFLLIAAQEQPICACDVVGSFAVSQPTVAHHLKLLHAAGLISAARRGVWAFYAVTPLGEALLEGALAATVGDRTRVSA